ncbi:MAG: glycoside hydrolase family 31 protein [Ferruginibacter sp.]
MKSVLFFILSIFTLQAAAQKNSFVKNKDGITVYPQNGPAKAISLKVWNNNIIRVTASPLAAIKPDTSFIIAGLPLQQTAFTVKENNKAVVLATATIFAVVDKASGNISYFTSAGNPITQEKERQFTPVQLENGSAYSVVQQFSSPEDEGLYGLGQHQQGVVNYKGTRLTLYQNNTEVFVPFLVSSKNYGILWDNYSITDFGDGRNFTDISALKLFSKTGNAGSLTATYLSKKDEQTIYAQQNERKIDYADLVLMKNLPAAFKMEEGKAVWEGAVEPMQSGQHIFRLWAGGYLKMWVDDQLLLDRWRQCWNPFAADVPVQLTAGKKSTIKIEWIPDGGESYVSCKVMQPAAAENNTKYGFSSEAANNINYFFVYGKTYDDIISGYRNITGKAPLTPKWTLGFWQSRERYKTQDEVLNTVKTFREKNIPLDNIVMDWQYWKINEWGSQQFDPARFSNPDSMIDVLHKQYHAKFMISVWAKFYKGIPNFELMHRQGFLLNRNADEERKDWLGYVSTFYDVHNPAARKQFWQLLNSNLYNKKIDAWWMDAPEPDIHSNFPIAKRKELFYPNAMGSAIQYFNSYPLLNSQGIYEGQRSTNDNKRVFILTRSGFAGIQRYGSAVWSGDIGSTWADMKNQIAAGINFSMSGVPYWTFDAGGFAVERRYEKGEDKPEWKELQARWYQFGSFLPLFRAHGQYPYREPYNIAGENEPEFAAMKSAIEMRYKLLPHLYSLAAAVHYKNSSILRGLMMDFPADIKTLNNNTQFMCGPSLLVSPVYTFGQRSRELYLPAGVNWFDFYTNAMQGGGQIINADAPIGHIPVFVKEGSIIVTGPVMQYSTEKPADTLTITIYGNKDAAYSLYEDENENYNYEKGKSASIQMQYKAATQTLTLQKRSGSFNGMLQNRIFKIVRIDKKGNSKPLTVKYNGSAVSVAVK